MILPVSCDAILYHWPYATVGLIAANVLAFIVMVMGVFDPLNGWVLMYGEGLHPGQWLLSLFVHDGLGHLLGNMFFLWVFGMVTEGKLGWWRFLACYFLIGVSQSAWNKRSCWGLCRGKVRWVLRRPSPV
jgi:membrane associated rhomboid family serine protease